MATDILRTARDDALDALQKLDEAERELINWRAHLLRVVTVDPMTELPTTLQARRCASIVACAVETAVECTKDAVRHAELPRGALPA